MMRRLIIFIERIKNALTKTFTENVSLESATNIKGIG